jgi:hypothetical protein
MIFIYLLDIQITFPLHIVPSILYLTLFIEIMPNISQRTPIALRQSKMEAEECIIFLPSFSIYPPQFLPYPQVLPPRTLLCC